MQSWVNWTTRKCLWHSIANGPFQSWRYPRIASWGIFSRPCGTGSFLRTSTQDSPRISWTLLWTHLRMRLTLRKAARGSVTPTSFSGHPGPSWATLSRPYGTRLERAVLTQTLKAQILLDPVRPDYRNVRRERTQAG